MYLSHEVKITNSEQSPIVIVDDDEILIEITQRCYERSELRNELLCFGDGEKLLTHLDVVQAGKAPMPALILLDINMPKVSGFEVLQAIREKERFKEVPVIVMFSTSDAKQDINQAFKLGAQGYKVKPDSPIDFVKFFKSLAS